MRRRLLGVFMVSHGLAHSLAGVRLSDPSAEPTISAVVLAVTALWLLASVGFVGGGLGLVGSRLLRPYVWTLIALGMGASGVLLAGFWRSPWSVPGLLLDAFVLTWLGLTMAEGQGDPRKSGPGGEPPKLGRVRRLLASSITLAPLALVLYMGAVIALRPWHVRWGSDGEAVAPPLPGEEGVPVTFRIHHSVLIAATPAEIWPWLVQMGRNRGGFYSYTWLENLFGLDIENAEVVHPEWQGLAVGDTVFATPDGYLGGRGRFGWRVASIEPERALQLENWGTWLLEPLSTETTRLAVRIGGAGSDDLLTLALTPLGTFGFEPVHFLMERAMLLGIKKRVERDGPGASGT